MPDDRKWYHAALCDGMKLAWFHEDYEKDSLFAGVMDGICMSCPVREICLEEGIDNKEHGLWGGVYLDAGKIDTARNAHKTKETWKVVNDGLDN